MARCLNETVLRGEVDPIKVGDKVYLSTANLRLPKGRAKKLLPRYIGPYTVLKARPRTSNYELDLPEDLKRRRIHPVFHISKLRHHEPNDETMFPHREANVWCDLGSPNDLEWKVDRIIGHKGRGKCLKFNVRWLLGDKTWETAERVEQLSALDEYLALQGVNKVSELR